MESPNRFQHENRLGLAHLAVAFTALAIGTVFGVLQAMVRSGAIPVPTTPSYYQFLTAHGILMAIVLTTLFIFGFLVPGTARSLDTPLSPLCRTLAWIGFWLMVGSTVVIVEEVLRNAATVLYTFYAPLQASGAFYIALTLFIVGTWVSSASLFIAYAGWKRVHPGLVTPLFAFTAIATLVMWLEATVGVAIEALFQLIPWSLGWEPHINVELSRTLFWYFGHPLVYFWLMPAYIAWYTIIPKFAGGKTFSDTLTRLAFLLLVVFSIPVGFHHELMDAGLMVGFKYVQVALTYCVVVPSLMTAFSVAISMEQAGRSRGGTGLFGWLFKLPWGDARFLAPALGMIAFIFGGAGGIVNASAEMDATVHNTLWIVGHFHITLATSVILTYFGITYWLLPMMTGKPLWAPRLASLQAVVWVVGMTFMSGAMHIVGLLGDPRRTASTDYGGSAVSAAWDPYMTFVGIGGAILGVGVIMFLAVVLGTVFSSKRAETEFPIAEVMHGGLQPPPILERWTAWISLTVVLVIIAYAVPVWNVIADAPPGSPGYNTWGSGSAAPAPASTPSSTTPAPAGQVSFAHDVESIFQAHCAACHISTVSGGLSLASYAALQKGGTIVPGPVFKAGDPAHSILIQIVSAAGPWPGGVRMPLGGPYLSNAEIATITKWIDQGAKNN